MVQPERKISLKMTFQISKLFGYLIEFAKLQVFEETSYWFLAKKSSH